MTTLVRLLFTMVVEQQYGPQYQVSKYNKEFFNRPMNFWTMSVHYDCKPGISEPSTSFLENIKTIELAKKRSFLVVTPLEIHFTKETYYVL